MHSGHTHNKIQIKRFSQQQHTLHCTQILTSNLPHTRTFTETIKMIKIGKKKFHDDFVLITSSLFLPEGCILHLKKHLKKHGMLKGHDLPFNKFVILRL